MRVSLLTRRVDSCFRRRCLMQTVRKYCIGSLLPKITQGRFMNQNFHPIDLAYDVVCKRNLLVTGVSYSVKYKVVKLPSLSPTMEQGVIKSWEKNEGDFVDEGETLAQIETDKAVIAMETPYKGYLGRILQREGTSGISINEPIAIIVNKQDDISKLKLDDLEELSQNNSESIKFDNKQSYDNSKTPSAESNNYPKYKIVKLPSLSPTMEHGTLTSWKKNVGDKLEEGDELALIETDKAIMSMETPYKGYLAKLLVSENTDNISVNHPIAVITPKKEDVQLFENFTIQQSNDTSTVECEDNSKDQSDIILNNNNTTAIDQLSKNTISSNSNCNNSRIKASPYAKKLAKEYNTELDNIKGSGPSGRIIAKDVIDNINDTFGIRVEQQQSVPSQSTQESVTLSSSNNYIDIPLTNMRKVIAERLTHSKQTIPHYYLTTEINVDKLIELRLKFNNELSKDGIKLSLNDFIVKAASICLASIPESNSAWMETFIRQYRNVDINIAVSTSTGLITPYVKDVNHKGLIQISNEIKDLVQRARNNKLALSEYQGGTFTISNLGMYGVASFCAVINPPQCAILAVGSISKIMVPDDENKPVIKSIMYSTLSADHRVFDGAMAAEWMKKFKNLIENPINMLL